MKLYDKAEKRGKRVPMKRELLAKRHKILVVKRNRLEKANVMLRTCNEVKFKADQEIDFKHAEGKRLRKKELLRNAQLTAGEVAAAELHIARLTSSLKGIRRLAKAEMTVAGKASSLLNFF